MTAQQLTVLQRCPRRFKLETEYRVLRRRPREVFEAILRDSILKLSSGTDVKTVSTEATVRFLETAARPGLDVSGNPYTLARDFCAMLETVLEAVSRVVLLAIKPGPTIRIGDIPYRVSAFQDESGLLHRWVAVDRWDEDARYRELHGWPVFGDCAAVEQGMWLHVVEIGRSTKGHQQTPWCRAYRHPVILGHYRFRKTDGSPLEKSWKPVWYQDSAKNDAKSWVDLMEHDRLELIHHVQVREPAPEHVEMFRRELAVEAARATALPDWRLIPMHRPACDLPPCPWQPVCYGPSGVDIEMLGGFERLPGRAGISSAADGVVETVGVGQP